MRGLTEEAAAVAIDVATAAATIALANGQATANKALAASLSEQILQYQYIQKLTDKVQVMLVPSGNASIFDLKGLLNPAPSPSTAP
jgi:regulator of protease activity HflC (stomatin/prohibitin superfamily)